MKDGEMMGKVHNSVYQQCRKRGYAAPVDVGILQKQKYEEIEKAYATHYVDSARIVVLKEGQELK